MSGQFRLGVVLRLREMAEEAARVALAQAHDGHRVAARHLEGAITAETEEVRYHVALAGRSDVQALQLQLAADAVAQAARIRISADERVSAAAQSLFEARAALAEASSRRQVVERLRDRAAAAAALDLARRQEAEMAEIAAVQRAWSSIDGAAR